MSATPPSTASNLTVILYTIQKLGFSDLTSLEQAARAESALRLQKVKDIYGQWFSDLIGLERLCNLPEVPASQLGLADADKVKYPSNLVLPSHFSQASAVRGIMGSQLPRPFVAVKVTMFDPTTHKVVATVAELIFKRYAINADGGRGRLFEDNYVTALHCKSSNGEQFPSNLYASGGMTAAQLTALKDLLQGKTIEAPVTHSSKKYLLRMA